jgi:hypothetical protein
VTNGGRKHTREDSGLRLDRQQRWWHDDEPIEHPNIIRAFERGLKVGDDGRFRLEFGDDWALVQVEACAFRVVAVDVSEGDRLSLRLSDLTAEWLDAATLAEDDDGALTVAVKGGRARARFTRDAQVQLAEHLVEDGGKLLLAVGGKRWPTPLEAR